MAKREIKYRLALYKSGGYVADYNESEGSCEWVRDPEKATHFTGSVKAAMAAANLDLSDFDIVVV